MQKRKLFLMALVSSVTLAGCATHHYPMVADCNTHVSDCSPMAVTSVVMPEFTPVVRGHYETRSVPRVHYENRTHCPPDLKYRQRFQPCCQEWH